MTKDELLTEKLTGEEFDKRASYMKTINISYDPIVTNSEYTWDIKLEVNVYRYGKEFQIESSEILIDNLVKTYDIDHLKIAHEKPYILKAVKEYLEN